MDTTGKLYLPGDLLFFIAGKNPDIWDTAIEDVTGSNIVHVAIAESAFMKIESTFYGIVRSPIANAPVAYSYYLHEHGNTVVAQNVSKALSWLSSQVGSMYGYGDIANALLQKFEMGFSVSIGDHFDCSGLATEFLIMCGGTPASQLVNAHSVTPVQLARVLGVL